MIGFYTTCNLKSRVVKDYEPWETSKIKKDNREDPEGQENTGWFFFYLNGVCKWFQKKYQIAATALDCLLREKSNLLSLIKELPF